MKKSELKQKIDDIITNSLFQPGGTKTPKKALLELGAEEELTDCRFRLNEFVILVDGMNYDVYVKRIEKISEAKKYFDYITEKKIAYNYFFRYSINYDVYREGLEEKIIQDMKNNDDLKNKRIKFDILTKLVYQNLKNYMDNRFIAFTFNDIDEKIQYTA